MKKRVRKLMASLMLVILMVAFISQSIFAASHFGSGNDLFDEYNSMRVAAKNNGIKTTDNAWEVMGVEGFSKGAVEYTSIALDNNNIPYVAYVDNGNSRKVTVKKFTDNGWKTVGNEGFSVKNAKDTSIVLDKSNIPYVVYIEESNGKIVVNKFVNNKWTNLGSNVGFGEDVSMAVDSKGTPYVAYTYSAKNKVFGIRNQNGVVVSKFLNGRWKTEFSVGSLLRNDYFSYPAVALDILDNPYVAFNNNGINVKKISRFGLNRYENACISNKGIAKFITLAIDNKRNPFVAYQGYKGKAVVSKYTKGDSWEISEGKAEYTSIVLDDNGIPYVAYMDYKNGSKAVVKKYEDGKWYAVGNEGFSKGSAKYTSIAMDNNGTLYVVYQDGGKNKKATVCTYSPKYVVTFDSNGGTEIDSQYVAYNGKVQIPAPPVKEGYIFENWYKDEALSEVFDFDTLLTGSMTLYAKYTVLPTGNLTINTDGNGSVVDWTYSETKSFVLGTEITLTAIAEDGSTFMYWKDSGSRVVSTESEFVFEIGCDETLTAYFFENDKHLVTFKNGNGEIIKSVYVTEGEEVDFPESPSMFGYTFVGWDKTAEEINASTEDIVVTALFEKVDKTVTVSVYGGSGSGEYNIKDYVTVTANDPEIGQKFSHWEDELGNNLSYDAVYTFYASRDLILTAIYVLDTEIIDEIASIAITSITKTDDKISFVAERLVPEGNTVILHGILATKNSTTGASETDFIIGGQDVLKVSANTKGLVGVFVLNKIAAVDETWYARGFVIYKDSEENVITIYSSIVQETMN